MLIKAQPVWLIDCVSSASSFQFASIQLHLKGIGMAIVYQLFFGNRWATTAAKRDAIEWFQVPYEILLGMARQQKDAKAKSNQVDLITVWQ